MTQRAYNFAAGPAALPESVLEQVQREMLALPGPKASILGDQPPVADIQGNHRIGREKYPHVAGYLGRLCRAVPARRWSTACSR